MKIKQVEELVGITRKNIRFYEEQGLLQVARADNGYREYHMQDVRRLQQIRLLRKLSVPLEDIRALFAGTLRLDTCLSRQTMQYERQKRDLDQMTKFCEMLMQENASLESLDAELCLERMEHLEKEGTSFMDVNKTDVQKKRRNGAVLGAAFMICVMLAVIALVLWANTQEEIPMPVLCIVIGIPAVMIVGVLAALRSRLREIKGGEEDEALGMVKGTIVQTKNVGKDFMAGMKTLVGGEIVGYTQMLEEARQIAVKRMVDEAKALGADAIIGVRYGSSQLMAGAAEVIAYGTAVRILNK